MFEILVLNQDLEGAIRRIKRMMLSDGILYRLKMRERYPAKGDRRRAKRARSLTKFYKRQVHRDEVTCRYGEGRTVGDETLPSWRFERMDGECFKVITSAKEMRQR